MKLLILGSGGREHALAWKASQELKASDIFLYPGNDGVFTQGFSALPLPPGASLPVLAQTALEKGITAVLIGPEAFLAEGAADIFLSQGLLVFGPTRKASNLETSKDFAKKFMADAGIPTARYVSATTPQELRRATESIGFPCVLKYDGLAAGKGVEIVDSWKQAEGFYPRFWKDSQTNPPILVEEKLIGKEVSYFAFCDGTTFIPLSSATDYKRIYDGDEGPNTGGMGAVSPSPWMTSALEKKIHQRVLEPFLRQLQRDGLDYRGVVFCGLMIDDKEDPYVLEFNTRFGDPETQSLCLRGEFSLVSVVEAVSQRTLHRLPSLAWKPEKAVVVVAASAGYPEKPRLGDPISGLNAFPPKAPLFLSGVALHEGTFVTQGGRVLSVGGLGGTHGEARQKAYHALTQISFPGMHYRKDIASFT